MALENYYDLHLFPQGSPHYSALSQTRLANHSLEGQMPIINPQRYSVLYRNDVGSLSFYPANFYSLGPL
jgi:hypothetical protein